jgi:hypothetical protein
MANSVSEVTATGAGKLAICTPSWNRAAPSFPGTLRSTLAVRTQPRPTRAERLQPGPIHHLRHLSHSGLPRLRWRLAGISLTGKAAGLPCRPHVVRSGRPLVARTAAAARVVPFTAR